jgi:hypothetical protein
MARIYRAPFDQVTISAVQDLIQVTGATGKMCRVLQCVISPAIAATIATNAVLGARVRFLPATVTPGTGGTTPSIGKNDPGDSAASFTALANNTSKATTSGTAVVHIDTGFHNYQGYDSGPLANPIPFGPSEAVVFELTTAPPSGQTFSGYVEVEEVGG